MNALIELAFVAATVTLVAYWGWMGIEQFLLARVWRDRPSSNFARVAIAVAGAVIVLFVARGVIHWGRMEGIGDAVQRRLVVGPFVGLVILCDLFRIRSRQWFAEASPQQFWAAKLWAYGLLFPVFVLSVIKVPVMADQLTVSLVGGIQWVLNVPVLGVLITVATLGHWLVNSVVSGIGLLLLKGSGSRR